MAMKRWSRRFPALSAPPSGPPRSQRARSAQRSTRARCAAFGWPRARDWAWRLPVETEVGDQMLTDRATDRIERGNITGRVGGPDGQVGHLLERSRQERPGLRCHALGDEFRQA